MRVLVTGGTGVLGGAMTRRLRGAHSVRALDRLACDVTESFTVQRVFSQLRPDVVLHCAGLSRIDACETRPDLAYRTNAQGSANVAAACQRLGARLIAFSTASVFDGRLDRPYDESDTPNPRSAFGRSKLAAEQLIRSQCDDFLVLRLSWLYGPGETRFSVRTLDEAARPGVGPLRAISDERGNPTSADAVADFVALALANPTWQGLWHLAATGEATWHEAAQVVAAKTGSRRRVVPCLAKDAARSYAAPENASLACGELARLGLAPLPHWLEQLDASLERAAKPLRAAA